MPLTAHVALAVSLATGHATVPCIVESGLTFLRNEATAPSARQALVGHVGPVVALMQRYLLHSRVLAAGVYFLDDVSYATGGLAAMQAAGAAMAVRDAVDRYGAVDGGRLQEVGQFLLVRL